MRAFAAGFYSNLMRLYDHLDVKYHSQGFLFSFSRPARCSGSGPYMVHASNFHQFPQVPRNRDLFQWLAEGFYVLLFYLWFTVCCFLVAPSDSETLHQYLSRIRLPEYYVASYLLPLISSVCTCSHKELLQFPATDVLEYKKRTHRQNHYVVTDGVHTVQQKLLKGLDVRLGVHSTQVSPSANGVEITSSSNGEESIERFDLAVLAVSPDVIASIFKPLDSTLKLIPTTTADTVAHTDYSTISPMLCDTTKDNDVSAFCSSSQRIYFMSNNSVTEAIHEHPNSILVTTNPLSPIDPSKTLHSATFTRVLRTPQSRHLINELFREEAPRSDGWRNGDDGVYLAGGWCWDGMVLLEGCVVSAMRIASDLNVEIPWETS